MVNFRRWAFESVQYNCNSSNDCSFLGSNCIGMNMKTLMSLAIHSDRKKSTLTRYNKHSQTEAVTGSITYWIIIT